MRIYFGLIYFILGATLDPLTIRLIDLISSAVAFIFTWACLFQRIELVMSDVKYGMIDSLYVVVITTATVRYVGSLLFILRIGWLW